jgi:hypothetical protein
MFAIERNKYHYGKCNWQSTPIFKWLSLRAGDYRSWRKLAQFDMVRTVQ